MSDTQVTRVTMFKIPKEEDRQKMIKHYEHLKANQKKDGEPYIISLEAGPLEHDQRSNGYTFVSKTVFKDKKDFDYYDVDCEAHKELKARAKQTGVEGPPMMVYFTPTVRGGKL